MTMFTAENRQQHQQSCGGYGVYGGGGVEGFGGGMSHSLEGCYILSDHQILMAAAEEDHHSTAVEDDRKAESSSKDDELVITRDEEDEEQEQEEEEEEQGWLQLGIGGGRSHQIKKQNGKNNVNENKNESGRVELELMPSSSNNNNNSSQLTMRSTFAPPLFPEFRAPRPVLNFETSGGGGGFISPPSSSFLLQQYGISSTNYYPHQEMNWAAFRHVPIISNIGGTASSSQTSSSLTYYPRPQFQLYAAGVDMDAAAAAAAMDFRVIPPPRRPHSGIWFMLQASQNQEKEPFLPQITKSYLRIKDGGMTIRLVIKYLVNKLRLDNESEVEITCKGQRVASFLTLEHVRDSIWSSSNPNRDFITLLPNSSTIPHIMVLHYARTSTS
ncbi:hypothetical protein ABFS82_11G077900 [Erythranthe guttata]|uniref:uncharacterized protein LOC105958063 n=1 Tax=Erythranthe guttata TaxID=4155 RepID=UPI00064DF3C8|nr:PREDICTED: uncharacterized protein LOC105958063 [Erythranthe guttata]|eukprot:XP_012837522.1 PREDICTED: uncharacterized protein LOC105958063 [Erythranthe guttata]